MRLRKGDSALGVGAWTFALVGLLLGLGALAVAGEALSRSDDANDAVALGAGTQVSLSEFAITPGEVDVASGGSLTVTNNGSVEHNLAVKGTDLHTPYLKP